jgi:pterin-4a-carbinolamine dehydratase
MARLDDSEIEERLERMPWRREGETIVRDLECKGHHPDILIHDYKHVRLTLSTHSAGGITENDFGLAGTIDGLVADAS